MARIKLLQVVYGFSVGGAELKLLELLSRLDRNKFDITVVCLGIGGPLEGQFRALGLPLYYLPKARRFDYTLPFKLAQIARRVQADIIMTTLFFADIIGALATFLYKPKALISWEAITGQLRPHQIKMYKMVSQRFDCVAAVSNSIWPYIIRDRGQDEDKICTIYYGVDLDRFAPAPLRKPQAGVIFGTVARLVHQKGHTYLLDAIPPVIEKYPQSRWIFAGAGEKEAELKAKTRALGLGKYVQFLGRRQDVPELLAELDVFILPSMWEGFPNVLLEAMARCKPVIATAVEGSDELVLPEQTGLLVEKANPMALANAMLRVLDQPSLIAEWGSRGRARVEEHFTLEKQVRAFEDLYESYMA